MKTLVLVSALLQPAPAATIPALYSFNDVYRLTVSGAAMGNFPAAAGTVRVAVSSNMPAPPPRPDSTFSVREVPAPPQPAILAFAGLAAAFWVARRKLGYLS